MQFLRVIIIHQSFVTTASMGPGNSGDFDFSLCKTRVYVWHCGDIFVVKSLPKALLISRQANVKLQRLVLAWNQKPQFHYTAGTILRSNVAHKPRYVPAIPGPMGAGVTHD